MHPGASPTPLPACTYTFGPGQARQADLEVLLTDGLGGFSLGSVAGVPTRCYSALNVSERPPLERYAHLVSPLEVLTLPGGQERALHALEIGPGTFEGSGLEVLTGVTLLDLLPEREQFWRGVRVNRLALMPRGSGAVVYLYDVSAAEPVTLTLGGFLVDRDMHAVHTGVPQLSLRAEGQTVRVEGAGQGGHAGRSTRLSVQAPGAVIDALEPQAYPQRVYYRHDAARGEKADELTLGAALWQVHLPPGGGRVALVVSGTGADIPQPWAADPWAAHAQEVARRRALVEGAWQTTGVRDDVVATLAVAADAYLVRRARSGGEAGVSVIAGYPWFADWGRDAMIALTGLTLLTGRHAEARDLLRTFLGALRGGLTPNHFRENGTGAGYNTVDGALWLAVALERYVGATGDLAFAREALPRLRELLHWHVQGTEHGIQVDEADGLLLAGEAGVQLTWMDVKIGDWVVTPRHGKPVEVQGLWLAALGAEARIAEVLGESPAAPHIRERARAGFAAFWDGQSFADTLLPGGTRDGSVRPNAVIALALPDTPATPAQTDAALRQLEAELLTPLGLHTLSPNDARYRGDYGGAQVQRDAAYHQGTVWPWPLASYVDTLLARGQPRRARDALRGLTGHLFEAGVGHVSEVFSGDTLMPGGCPFQAWSVAELLRAHVLTTLAERAAASSRRP